MSKAALKPAVALKAGQTAKNLMSRKTCMSAPRMGGWLVLYGFCDHSQQPSLWQEARGADVPGGSRPRAGHGSGEISPLFSPGAIPKMLMPAFLNAHSRLG